MVYTVLENLQEMYYYKAKKWLVIGSFKDSIFSLGSFLRRRFTIPAASDAASTHPWTIRWQRTTEIRQETEVRQVRA